ncbi:MAG: hypothetical protein HY806_08950 [Nitrospirae bacterium]|nr:hypothetical protein [Nitrospirota bacterium]
MKISKIVVSDELFFGLCAFIACYVFIMTTGIFSPYPEGLMKTLHNYPALFALLVLLVSVCTRMIMDFRAGNKEWIYLYCGFIMITAGIFVSSLTRFEGRMILAEGQIISGARSDYIPETLYLRKFAAPPRIAIELNRVSPLFKKTGKGLWYVSSGGKYQGQSRRGDFKINSLVPLLLDGTFYTVKGFGYAPKCFITGPSGDVMNDAYSIMKLFPPDAEDSFRLLSIPHTFYLRYYPEGLRTGGASASGQKKGPLYKLRIAKNLDILFNGYVSQNENIAVGSISVSIVDIKKWVEVAVVRDYGIYLIIPGIAIAVISAIWGAAVRQKMQSGRVTA